MKNKISTLFAFATVLIATSTTSLKAEEYNYTLQDFNTCANMGRTDLPNNGMKSEYIDTRFNDVTNKFTIEARFSNSRGQLPNGMHFGVRNGPMPEGLGNIAMTYFDATDPSNIKVTGYSYNQDWDFECGNNLGSWFASSVHLDTNTALLGPDLLFSSISGARNTSAVVEKSSVDTTVAGVTYRTFKLVLDASVIGTATPYVRSLITAPYAWEGVKFDNKIGMWFYADRGISSSYTNLGMLNTFYPTACYICDFDNASTNKTPSCDGIELSAASVKPGDTLTAKIKVKDAEKDQMSVSYSDLPSGSTTNPASGGNITLDSTGKGFASISLKPAISDIGSKTINATFTQNYGNNKAQTTCPLTFTVAGCEKQDLEPQLLTLDNNLRDLTDATRTLHKRIGKNRTGKNKFTAKELANKARAEAVFTEAWNLLFSIPRDRVLRVSCGASATGCDSYDFSRAMTRFKQVSTELYGIAQAAGKSLSNVLTKKGIRGAANNAKWKPLVAKAQELNSRNQTQADNVPTSLYLCEKK